MLGNLRVGDMIKTIGGFYGKVVMIKEDLDHRVRSGQDEAGAFEGAIASVESFEEGKGNSGEDRRQEGRRQRFFRKDLKKKGK